VDGIGCVGEAEKRKARMTAELVAALASVDASDHAEDVKKVWKFG
jgi:hypothetical protein